MRKMKKLVRYLLLLAIPVAIAAALFVFNGSGYRLSEQDAADIGYKKVESLKTRLNLAKVRTRRQCPKKLHKRQLLIMLA